MAKGNITNVLPMILIGGWINWHYSGFITSKVAVMDTLKIRKLSKAQEILCVLLRGRILQWGGRCLTNYLATMATSS